MPCRSNDFNPIGIHMDTWSGDNKGGVTEVCSLNGTVVAKHCISIDNHLSRKTRVYVRGIINSTINKAKFVGHLASGEKLWRDEADLGSASPNDTISFNSVKIDKKNVGKETITVEVEYENPWPPFDIKRADRESCPLRFDVDVV